jgi:lyso-ornithine lipid O-acyltransferase
VSAVRGILILGGFLLLTMPLMPVQALFNAAWLKMARRFPHWYHRVLARILGLRVHVEGIVPKTGPAFIVANHVSWLDIVALSAALPVSFIAKQEVRGWPLFGQMARLQRTVFVDRERRAKTGIVRNDIASRLAMGDLLVLFPEGTSHDGQHVLPFKSSLFGVTSAAGATVIPVTIAYTRKWNLPMTRRQRPACAWYGDMDLRPHLWDFVRGGPVEVRIVVHGPLDGKEHRKTLSRLAESTIRSSLSAKLQGLHGTGKIG